MKSYYENMKKKTATSDSKHDPNFLILSMFMINKFLVRTRFDQRTPFVAVNVDTESCTRKEQNVSSFSMPDKYFIPHLLFHVPVIFSPFQIEV